MNYTEEQLIEGIRNNDDKALSALYRSHYPSILHFILANNGSEQEARDVYQEAFIVFYEKIRSAEFVLYVKVKTFLYSVCRNIWLKKLLDKKKYVSQINDFEQPEDVTDIFQQAEDEETRFLQMGAALAELGEPCRSLIEDFYIQGCTMHDIVTKYGYTNTDNAKNQKYKCLQRLKKLFFSKYTTREDKL